MNIFDQYGIKEVADVTLYSIHKKNDGSGDVYYVPALYLDTLKISSIEKTAENTWAQGGKGNSRLINWDYGKQINVTLEDALCTPASLGMCWNGTLNADWKDGSVNVDTEVCYCKNPVKKLPRLEKAIFPRDTNTKNTVSELLPHIEDDEIDQSINILKSSSVVDGTTIKGNGMVRNHGYRWKMAIESGVMSIAQIPDRFFDVTGVSYPIDWNRKVSVTSLPDYENYKDAIIYKINSSDSLKQPEAKIIYDDAMLSIDKELINNLRRIYGYENIINTNMTFFLERVNQDEPQDSFVLKNGIFYKDPNNEQLYIFVEENMYNQFNTLWKTISQHTTSDEVYGNTSVETATDIAKDLKIFLDCFDKFVPIITNAENYDSEIKIESANMYGEFTVDANANAQYINAQSMGRKNEISELQTLYKDTQVIVTENIEFWLPIAINEDQYSYPSKNLNFRYELQDIVFLCNKAGEKIALLCDKYFYEKYRKAIDYIEQTKEKIQSIPFTNSDLKEAWINMPDEIITKMKQDLEKITKHRGKFKNAFINFSQEPNEVKENGIFLGEVFDDKYNAYLNLESEKVKDVYNQNQALTSLFAFENGYSSIPDELGSVNRVNIQHRPIDKADYLAIIIDNNDDYYALIGMDSIVRDQFKNFDYDGVYNPITWFQPETPIDMTQFKGLDMWIRFHSINEMIYFLITKYENDIIDITPSTIYANESDPTYGGGDGYWAVNKQVTTVEKNNDQSSVRQQGKLWAYVNPRTMMPYDDDYWFHNGEPLFVKSLTIAPENKRIKGNKIVVRADEWPGMYMMVGETFIRDKDTGTDERLQIKIPLCKVRSDHTITLQADGDPTTFNLNLEVARPASGAMMEITSYEVAKKLIEGENGCFYAADGATEVLSE